MAGIPVYLTRFGKLPKEYGALVKWDIGQRVRFKDGPDGEFVTGTVRSETKTHRSAPVIHGAMGQGQWVREILCDDTGQVASISESRLVDVDSMALLGE